MAWGMKLPNGFGEYWPLGEFEGKGPDIYRCEGWSERLREYYRLQTPEEQKRLYDYDLLVFDEKSYGADKFAYAEGLYPLYVAEKLIRERGTIPLGPDRRVPYSAVEPHEPPRFFQIERSPKTPASLIKLNGRVVAVDEALKDIIERREPGMHGFFPIEMRMPRGKVFPKNFYTFVVGQYFDSFCKAESDLGSLRANGEYHYFSPETKKEISGIALRKAVFGNAQLWRERRFKEWLICFSDDLISEIAQAGLRLPRHYKMKEV